ncbi:MAG: hypothetical protein ACLS9K_04525 [Lachnospira eligens]
MKRGKVSDTILDGLFSNCLAGEEILQNRHMDQDAAHMHNQGWDTLAAAATGSLAVYRAVNNISATRWCG